MSAIAAEPEPSATSLRAATEILFGAFSAGGALAPALLDAWRVARNDKRTALALAWAREQLRLAIADVIAREAKALRMTSDAPIDALAWALLVAAEACVHEAPGSPPERIDAALALVRHAH
jgi:hypothetical protein